MESTKTRSKNKSSLKQRISVCFRPVTLDDAFEPTSKRGNADAVLSKYFAVTDQETDGALPAILSSALESSTVAECKEGSGSPGKKKEHHVSTCLWHVLKTALNATSLARKLKKRRKAKYSKSGSSKVERKDDKISKPDVGKSPGTSSSSSTSFPRSSSAFTPSSLSSSTRSTSSSGPLASGSPSEIIYRPRSTSPINTTFAMTMIKKQENGKDGRKLRSHGSNKALCLLIISSLVVLIIWGKLSAILCTSTCFYFVPRRSRQWRRAGGHEGTELDSVEYKKKIIMEGLLERSRSRVCIESAAKS